MKHFTVLGCIIEGDLRRHGRISMIFISTGTDSYEFDVLRGIDGDSSYLATTGLQDILESNGIVKVMQSCSRVSDALQHLHGVRLCNVWDTNVAHTLLNPTLSMSSPLESPRVKLRKSKAEAPSKVLAIMNAEWTRSLWEKRPLSKDLCDLARKHAGELIATAEEQANLMSPELELMARNRFEQAVCALREQSSAGAADLSPGEVLEFRVVEGKLLLLDGDDDGKGDSASEDDDDEGKDVLAALTVAELRSQLRSLGLRVSGKKQELQQRLQTAIGAPESTPDVWERKAFLQVLPKKVLEEVICHEGLETVVEVVMDVGRPAVLRYRGHDGVYVHLRLEATISSGDLQSVCSQLQFSPKGRAVISSSLHRVSALRDSFGAVIGLTVRCGRHVSGCLAPIEDLVRGGSLLVVGPPGSGKTTILRGISALLSDTVGKRVVIVDGSNEIAGEGTTPHPCVGSARRIMVRESGQEASMIEAVENHTPEVIVVDEVSTKEQAQAARTIRRRGVDLTCTCHGNSIWDVMRNSDLSILIGGITSVTLGGRDPRYDGLRKTVQERDGDPLFDCVVEVRSPGRFFVHRDAKHAIDEILAGRRPVGELRERMADGRLCISRVAS